MNNEKIVYVVADVEQEAKGANDASKEAMVYINRIKSPYFVVVESATHLCTLMRQYQIYKTKEERGTNGQTC